MSDKRARSSESAGLQDPAIDGATNRPVVYFAFALLLTAIAFGSPWWIPKLLPTLPYPDNQVTIDNAAKFGDSVNVVNGLFTAAALAIAFYSLHLQRREAEQTLKALRLQQTESKRMIELIGFQTDLMKKESELRDQEVARSVAQSRVGITPQFTITTMPTPGHNRLRIRQQSNHPIGNVSAVLVQSFIKPQCTSVSLWEPNESIEFEARCSNHGQFRAKLFIQYEDTLGFTVCEVLEAGAWGLRHLSMPAVMSTTPLRNPKVEAQARKALALPQMEKERHQTKLSLDATLRMLNKLTSEVHQGNSETPTIAKLKHEAEWKQNRLKVLEEEILGIQSLSHD